MTTFKLTPDQGVPAELVPEPWKTMCMLRDAVSGNPMAVRYLDRVISEYGPGAINVNGTWHVCDSRSAAYESLLEVHRIRAERAQIKGLRRQLMNATTQIQTALPQLKADHKSLGEDERGMVAALMADLAQEKSNVRAPSPQELISVDK